MDELEQLIGGGQAATKAPPRSIPKTTQAQQQGVADLDTLIGQLETTLKDVAPNTATHTRLLADINAAKQERARYGTAPQAAPQAAPKAAPVDELESLIGGTYKPEEYTTSTQPGTMGAYVPRRPITPVQTVTAQIPQPVKAAASQLTGQFDELRRKLGASTASLADVTLGGVIPAIAGPVTYAGARALGQTPEEAAAAEQRVVAAVEKPIGRMLGVTQEPAYQQEASRRLMEFIGENFSKGAAWIANKVGLPVQDVQNMMSTGLVAAPGAVRAVAQQAKPVVQAVTKPVSAAMQELEGKTPVQAQVMPPQAVQQMQQQFAARQVPGQQMPGMGAAMTAPVNITRGNIDAAVAQASPELQTFIKGQKPEAVNLPALETRALEEKHGINLTRGQRTGDTALYSTEWNRRGETPTLGEHFTEQPRQFKAAFENTMQRYAPEVFDAEPSAIGQTQINALAAKDQLRRDAISAAYKKLEDAAGGQFPIDTGALKTNIADHLTKKLKTSHLSSAILSDLAEFYKNPTFESYEALRTNLANEMRSASSGNARQAAYIVRDELEKMPVFGENTGSPQAVQLKRLADDARRLVVERANVIKSNPAYRAAVKEAADVDQAAALGESLNAEKFHDKYVTKATPEAIRRMKAELADSPEALQSLVAGELRQAMKKAGVASDVPDLNPKTFANYIRDNKGRLQEALGPQAMQDLMELAALSSKIGMPKTGTFNYSNTFSGMLGEMAKQGLSTAAEAKLATMTGGASIPALSLTRQFMQKMNKEGFAKEAVNPYGGLTKEK